MNSRARAIRNGLRHRKDGAMDAITLKIGGMTCDGCASAVQKALERTNGVSTASVSMTPAPRAAVTYDPDLATPATLCTAVQDAGYDVTV